MTNFNKIAATTVAALSLAITGATFVPEAKAQVNQKDVTEFCSNLQTLSLMGMNTRPLIQGMMFTGNVSEEDRELLYYADQQCPKYL